MHIPTDFLNRLQDLYDRGLYRQAHTLAEPYGPWQAWEGAAARLLAGRLASNLGAPRLGQWLFLRAFREAPDDPDARSYFARTRLERRGPLAAWRFMCRRPVPESATTLQKAEWHSLSGLVTGAFRDFEAAERCFAQAEALAPEYPWVMVERAVVLEYADRYDEAVAMARRALEIRPGYRAAVQSLAHLLPLVGRDEEALDLLSEASTRLESALVVGQLILLQLEMERYADIPSSLERFAALTPIAEKEAREWMAGVGSDAAYHLGDIPEAVRRARESGAAFFVKVADRIEASPPDGKRVSLPVGFVRQHHLTCVPATLSAISRYWQMPADHLGVAEEICYDGTPWHSERQWAEDNGWTTREFRVTWESACALLDRGVPFTLTTMAPGYAHIQAVTGYDARRGTFLIRDPFFRNRGETLAAELLEELRSTGPRGMALVPRAEAARFDGIAFPDAALYDGLYRLQRALKAHRRAEALACYEAMRRDAPDHLMTLWARRALASYDADATETLACLEAMQALFPEDAAIQQARISCLRELARRDERLELLRTACARVRPRKERDRADTEEDRREADALFLQQYAHELLPDAREHDRVEMLLHRAFRQRPVDAENLYLLSAVLWERQAFEESLNLLRFAACVGDREERMADAYFSAARHLRRADEALQLLQDRFRRLGGLAWMSARTLFIALDLLERAPEAFDVLNEAMRRRPEEGDLLLFAAEQHARRGRFEEADAMLTRAEPLSARTAWLRAAAGLADRRGDLPGALALWRQVVETEPLAMDAHQAVARLLALTAGPAAAQRHFEAAAARFPYHYGLHQAWAEWLRQDDDPGAEEGVLRRLVEINPADAWTRRELALSLVRSGRIEEALVETELACRLDTSSTFGYSVQGDVYSAADRMEEARGSYREAIRRSADNDYAIGQLVAACDTPGERRDALQFVVDELERQTLFGDGLLAFRRFAQGHLKAEEVRALLQSALDARSDLWHAWSALINQLVEMGCAEEACRLAAQATERFPLQAALWLDLSAARRARADVEGERAALRQALQVAPGYSPAARALADSYERAGEFDRARELLEEAVRRDSLDTINHAALAYVLWKKGEKEAAVERLRALLQVDPDSGWAWDALREWCGEMGRAPEAVEAARDLIRRRPGEARSWLLLARTLDGPDSANERLGALDRAIELNPRSFEACDLRAQILVAEERFEEARAACRPANGASPPAQLRARAAWVLARGGDMPAAVSEMRALLEEEPGYYPGWAMLAQWYDDSGDTTEYAEAARRMVALAPQDARGYGYLGDALLRVGDRPGAKEALRRAMEMSPDYAFAGGALFDMYLEDGETEAAAQAMEVLAPHLNDGWDHALAVRLAVKRGDEAQAMARLESLCAHPEDIGGAMHAAASAMREAGWLPSTERILAEALNRPDVNPETGVYWVRCRIAQGNWDCEAMLARLWPLGEVGVRAAGAYIEEMAQKRQAGMLRGYVDRHGADLRAHGRTWGSVGYAFYTLGRLKETIDWMGDWRQRPDAEPWMLVNLAEAHRCLGQTENARVVSETALRQQKQDRGSDLHAVWLASDFVLAGAPQAAARRLACVNLESLTPFYRFLRALTLALMEVEGTAPTDGVSVGTQARQIVEAARPDYREARQSVLAHEARLLRQVYRRVVGRIVRRRPTPAALLWGAMRLAKE